MSNVIIGVDNGISGALACISAHNGALIDAIPMPIQKVRKGNEINTFAVNFWLRCVSGGLDKIKCVVVEEPGGSKSARAATSMAGSFHALRTVMELAGIKWHRITPQRWQKQLLPRCKAGDTKPRALELARRLWPDESFLATARSKVPHDGLIDAAIIAHFAWKTNL